MNMKAVRSISDRPAEIVKNKTDGRYHWSIERLDNLEKAIARGDSWPAMERRFGSKRQNLMNVARTFGIATRQDGDNKHATYSGQELATIIECCEKMMTDEEIGKLLGRPKCGIQAIRKNMGISKPNKTRVYIWLVSADRFEYTGVHKVRTLARRLGLQYSYLQRLKYNDRADEIRDLPASAITGLSHVLDVIKAAAL